MGGQRALATVAVLSSLGVLSCALLYFRQQQNRRRQKSCPFPFSHGGTWQYKKPQESFGPVLADNSRTPFCHLRTEENGNGFSHPYGERIRELLEHPTLNFPFMQSGYEQPPGMEGPLEWVKTIDDLQALVEVLSDEREFAVDTEQHGYHSFRGFTALVQISTRATDYLVDSIALHDSMTILGPVFANPAICKVFHGADSDILWLQRDFHIYVVNTFDTAKACLVLGKQQRSLSSLLQLYCDVSTNKAFQRADWRLRPLSKDMVQYARTDAHYLLYIAHRLCTELKQNTSDQRVQESGTVVDGNFLGCLLQRALYRSNLTCLNLYEKEGPAASPTSTSTALVSRYYKSYSWLPPSPLHEKFSNLVTSLCEWRDSLARIEDESLGSVLSDAALIALAISGPSTPELIYATIAAADASPLVPDVTPAAEMTSSTSPSPVVQKHMSDLHYVIHRNRADPLDVSRLQSLKPKISLRWFVEKLLSKFNSSKCRGEGRFQSQDKVTMKISDRLNRKRLGSGEKSRIQFVEKFSCKAPVYHNCRIYADDGRLLCYCDRKKLEWYVKRGLAVFVEEEPPSVRLLFEPKGRPEYEGNDFYIQSKTNQCVGCGESSHYLRYRIIPSCYRQHFPEHLKSHRSHDIVLLCVDCHEIAHRAAEKHKRQISVEHGIPLFAKVTGAEGLVGGQSKAVLSDKSEEGMSPLQLKNAAMALLRHGSTIPSQRRMELEKVVQTFYGRDNISASDLHSVVLLCTRPQEHRGLLKKSFFHGECATAVPLEIVNQDESGDGVDTSLSLRELEEPNPIAGSDEAISKPVSVNLTEIAVSHSIVNGRDEDTLTRHHLEETDSDKRLRESQFRRRRHSRHKASRHEPLFGHGVHGRRVVEILMEQDGDEKILEFCQRWRKVFVDAIHPAFLPSGWEVSHSGRREFGAFSIFKPHEEL